MIFDKYLNDTYLDILYSNYNLDYLKSIDSNNFIEIYNLLKSKGFYFIEDIIINYMDIFELDSYYLNKVLTYLEDKIYKQEICIKHNIDLKINDKIIERISKIELISKINYLEASNLELVDNTGKLIDIFSMSSLDI